MTTYLMALVLFTTSGTFIQSPAEPALAKSFYFDETGELQMREPLANDCYVYRQSSVTFKVFCRKEERAYEEAIVHLE